MMLKAGFFKTKTEDHKSEIQHSFIGIGGEQFHALAVALVDYLNSSPRIKDVTLKKILERFYFHYPKYISNQPYITPSERMTMLIKGERKSEIVECFAYVLRQLTVDEIYANPLNYREAFNGLDRDTPKSFLRQPSIVLPVSALRALAQATGINITVSFVEHGKELRKREIYSDDVVTTLKPGITIQIQHDNYFPAVRTKNKTDFAYVGQLAVSPPKPVESTSPNANGTIADMVDLIATDNKKLLQTYKQWVQNLSTMLQLGEITREKLISLYTKFLPSTNGSIVDLTKFFSDLAGVCDKPISGEAGILLMSY
ncbi:hypothetical protein [Legionella norrlandica]|uniref:hypothetical protein n=1 Tax=Legionella norrlandica TaxID=1498499 RepID=UPI001F4C5E8B|nr:hypothetical protein [Legionella norrlandica]